MTPMTSEEYVEYNGLRCPVCGKRNCMDAQGVDIIGSEAIQEVTCTNCGSAWYDVYKLERYELIEQGEVSE